MKTQVQIPIIHLKGWVWWCMPVTPVLEEQRQADRRAHWPASLAKIVSPRNRRGTVPQKLTWKAGKVTQQVRALAFKSDNLSSIPGPHMVEGENQVWQVVL